MQHLPYALCLSVSILCSLNSCTGETAGPYPADVIAWDAATKAQQREAGRQMLSGIEQAVANGETEILIPKGNYRFNEPTGKPALPYHIGFQNYEGVTIDFQGSTLWFETDETGIRLAGCRDVTLKNAKLDWDPLPYLQGKVVAINAETNTLDVKCDPGYGEKVLPGMKDGGYWRGFVFDSISRKMKPKVVSFGVSFSWDRKTEEDAYRLPFLGFHGIKIGQSGIAVGDSIVLLNRMGRAVRVEGCEDTVLEDITLYSSPFIGFVENTGKGNTHYLDCKIIPRPDTDRLIGGNADGFNCANVEVGPTIDSCTIDTIGDDFVNVHNDFARVLNQDDPSTLITSRLSYRNEIEGPVTVEFFERESLKPLGRRTATVEVVHNYEIKKDNCLADLDHKWHSGEAAGLAYGKTMWAVHRLHLNEPLEVTGDVVANGVDYMSAGAVIRNNDFNGSFARGIRLQAPGAVIEDNDISNVMGIGLSMGSHADYWGEGSYVSDTFVSGNTFRDICISQHMNWEHAAIFILLGGDVVTYKTQQNIRIENNWIFNCGAPAILAFGVNGLTISENTIVDYVTDPVPPAMPQRGPFIIDARYTTVAIGLQAVDNLVLSDNEIGSLGRYATAKVERVDTPLAEPSGRMPE